jgi:hypothetical protein
MPYQALLKNFIHTILVSVFSILVMFILIVKINTILALIIILAFLILWKMISGLANINFFILFSLFFSSLVFSWNFKIIPVLSFFILMILLFYFRVIDIKPNIKNNLPMFSTFKQTFLFSVFFYNVLSLYCLFYLNHWPFFIIFSLFAALSFICFSWYKKLNNIDWSLYEKIVIFLVFLQLSWFLFQYSNSFFIFPILIVFWFYNIIEIYKQIMNWNWNKTLNFIIFPILITIVSTFWIKL